MSQNEVPSPDRQSGELPIEIHVAGFLADLGGKRNGLVVASPGAGKTTVIPVRLLGATWLAESDRPGVILVQPRRVAALQAAKRLAQSCGESIGQTVGLRMRGDSRVCSSTRLTVVTEGVYLRMIQTDPTLAGVGAVILDEFHERSLDIDTACALTMSARELFVPELRLVVMSATLDQKTISDLLEIDGPVAILTATGASFPVETSYRPLGATTPSRPRTTSERLAEHAAQCVIDVINGFEHDNSFAGDVLVFLPGIHEIRVAARIITRWSQSNPQFGLDVLELHSRASPDMIERALARSERPVAGKPVRLRVVLATSIAQTSVTIDGVTVVIDTGMIRTLERDQSTGLTRLATTDVSQSTADQRSGRAGRTRPGQSIRLWARSDHARRPTYDQPAILHEDLSGLVLLIAAWGLTANELRWCDPPLPESIHEGEQLLRSLGALDSDGVITTHGQSMVEIPAHPRLAAMLVRSSPEQRAVTAAVVALLSDDPWRAGTAPTDLRVRLKQVFIGRDHGTNTDCDQGAIQRIRRSWIQLLSETTSRLQKQSHTIFEKDLALTAGILLNAYPDRLAVRLIDHPTTYRFASGLELELVIDADQTSGSRTGVGMQLSGCSILIATDLDGDRRTGRIRMAVPISLTDLETWVATTESDANIISIDTARLEHARVVASTATVLTIGESRLELTSKARLPTPRDTQLAAVNELSNNEHALHWSDHARRLLARLQIAHQCAPETWPMINPQAIVTLLRARLKAGLGSSHQIEELLDPAATIEALISEAGHRRNFDMFVPESWVLPNGTTRRISYLDEQDNPCVPTLSTRVQDLFGLHAHPTVCDGRMAIRVDLLSPAQRSVAVTSDIARFWKVGYPAVRIDMRGRYPRHYWPEDPLTTATSRPTS